MQQRTEFTCTEQTIEEEVEREQKGASDDVIIERTQETKQNVRTLQRRQVQSKDLQQIITDNSITSSLLSSSISESCSRVMGCTGGLVQRHQYC